MTDSRKGTAERRARRAIVYLRQSSERQVRHNQESQRLQYALVDRARDLGWSQVEVIDTDLGSSAAIVDRVRSRTASGRVERRHNPRLAFLRTG